MTMSKKKYTAANQPFGKLHLPWRISVAMDGGNIRSACIVNGDDEGGAYTVIHDMPKGMTQNGKRLWMQWAEFTVEAVNSYFKG